ncbi:hypothetical protein CBOM_01185 [Ceraceosorus bombacis]|uniref:Uncharacterized protein n=1 Tax=Ceraceosorus bombacis TaxID=401625 RepID=A0A0N7L9A6_9BASI|nr:hypothetical protein CBOM_01185 [Ceraceosorus bombacis]
MQLLYNDIPLPPPYKLLEYLLVEEPVSNKLHLELTQLAPVECIQFVVKCFVPMLHFLCHIAFKPGPCFCHSISHLFPNLPPLCLVERSEIMLRGAKLWDAVHFEVQHLLKQLICF